MLKLLLRQDRYEIKKEFSFRFLNLLILFSIFGAVIAGILLFASYLLIEYQERVVSNQVSTLLESDESLQKDRLRELEMDLKKHVDIFERETPHYSGFISIILDYVNDGITFNSMSFVVDENNKDELNIELRGQADTRNTLVNYSESLKDVEVFDSVNLPLSNLTRDIDVPFVISITTGGLNI